MNTGSASTEKRIGIIVGSYEQIPLAQEFASLFCDKFNLSDQYKYDLQLVIEEFLVSLFDSIEKPREVSFYLSFQEKAVRIIFDISDTGFTPVLAEFSPMEFETDEETHGLIGLTILKRMVDNIKHIKTGDKNEVHFIMYIGAEDFKDVYGFRRRFPIFNEDVIISETTVGGKVRYTLRLKDKDEYFSVSEKEYFIIQMLDGKHELPDFVQAFTEKYGPISPRSINRFINTLDQQNFLEPEVDIAFGWEYQEEEPKISLLEKILSFEYSLPNVDKLVTGIYKGFKWALSVPFMILIAISLGLLLHELVTLNLDILIAYPLKRNAGSPWIIAMYYGIMLLTVVVHEFAHAMTCKKYGGQVNKMGIMLYYFQLCAYADTSDAWLFKEKYKRVLTSLNGPIFSMFLASLCLWLYYMIIPVEQGLESGTHSALWAAGSSLKINTLISPSFGDILIMILVANMFTTFFNLMPFAEMDGYYILSDLLEARNVRMMAMGYVLNVFRRLVGKSPYPIHPSTLWKKIGYAVYGSLCWLYAGAFIGFILYFVIFKLNVAVNTVAGIFAIVSIVFFILKSMFLKRIQQKREFLRRKVISY